MQRSPFFLRHSKQSSLTWWDMAIFGQLTVPPFYLYTMYVQSCISLESVFHTEGGAPKTTLPSQWHQILAFYHMCTGFTTRDSHHDVMLLMIKMAYSWVVPCQQWRSSQWLFPWSWRSDFWMSECVCVCGGGGDRMGRILIKSVSQGNNLITKVGTM